MSLKQSHEKQKLWLRWMFFSAIGLAAGLATGFSVAAPIEAIVGVMLVTPAVTMIVGSVLGFSQWLVLRRFFSRNGWWILATAIGLGIGLTAGLVTIEKVGRAIAGHPLNIATVGIWGRAISFAVIGMFGGLGLGAGQWLSLRQYRGKTKQWLAVCALGLTAALVIGSLVADLVFGNVVTPAGFGVFLLIGGLIAGAITGKSLQTMISQPTS